MIFWRTSRWSLQACPVPWCGWAQAPGVPVPTHTFITQALSPFADRQTPVLREAQ